MLTPVIPLGLVISSGVLIALHSTEQIYHKHPILYIITFGFMTAKITNKLIVSDDQQTKP